MNELISYYRQELQSLEQDGAYLAKHYPESAGHLNLKRHELQDPQIAHLIEAIALLNARTQKKIDDEIPELKHTITQQLFPHTTAPIPSMAIIQMNGKADSDPQVIPKGTLLETDPNLGDVCTVQTRFDAFLAPIKLSDIGFVDPSQITYNLPIKNVGLTVLRAKLMCLDPGSTLQQAMPHTLRFYLNGSNRFTLYSLLNKDLVSFTLSSQNQHFHLNKQNITFTGFADNETMLPHPPQSFSGFELLNEYCCFSDKFMFADITLSDDMRNLLVSNSLTIDFYFDNALANEIKPTIDDFQLGCVPIINAFNKRAEPFPIYQHQAEYSLSADVRKADNYDILGVNSVGLIYSSGEKNHLQPAYKPTAARDYHDRYFIKDRRYFIPINTTGKLFRDDAVVKIDLLCSNGDLLSRLFNQYGDVKLQFVNNPGSLVTVNWLTTPTKAVAIDSLPQFNQLLEHLLALNLSSLIDDQADKLKMLLKLHNHLRDESIFKLTHALSQITTSTIVKRINLAGKICMCVGVEVKIYMRLGYRIDNQYLLFGKILNEYFARIAPLNSIIELVIINQDSQKELHRWSPQVGTKHII